MPTGSRHGMLTVKCGRIVWVAAIAASFASPAFPQSAIQARLVGAPMVAESEKWIVGGALAYATIKGSFNQYNISSAHSGEGVVAMEGSDWSAFAAYGDIAVIYAERNAKGQGEAYVIEPNSGSFTDSIHSITFSQRERELSLRWLARRMTTRFFTPYAVAGYTETKFEQSELINVGGGTGGGVRQFSYAYKGALAGIGAIAPLGERYGFRGQGALKFYRGTIRENGAVRSSAEGTGIGTDFFVSAYANVLVPKYITAEVGYRRYTLEGSSEADVTRNVLFATLGLTYRF